MKTFKKAIFVGILLLLVISTFALAETNPDITLATTTTSVIQNSSTANLDTGDYTLRCNTFCAAEAWTIAELYYASTDTPVSGTRIVSTQGIPKSVNVTITTAGDYYIKLEVGSGKGYYCVGRGWLEW